MGMAQGNFDRAVRSGRETFLDLLAHGQRPTGLASTDLSKTHKRELLTMLHDLEQVAAAIRLELMSRD